MTSESVTTPTQVDQPAPAARAAAVVTWAYAAGFGVPTVPVAVYLVQRGRLPSFLGLFDMYAGPWSNRLGDGPFVVLSDQLPRRDGSCIVGRVAGGAAVLAAAQ